MRNSYRWLILAGLVIATVAVGCRKMDGALVGTAGTPADPDSYTIWAGEVNSGLAVGHLDVWEDWTTSPATLHVKYVLTEPNWYLTRCQLAVEVELDSIPQRNGNPTPTRFEWDSGPLADATEHEFAVQFEAGWDINKVLHVAAHSALVRVVNGKKVQTEVGWGGTEPFAGRKWALYSLYTIGSQTPSSSGFRTVSQGDWGVPPEGNNWGQYLALHFEEVFEPYLRVGYGKWLLLTNRPAVTTYLADYGVPTKLSKSVQNPPANISVYAGQIVALTLNVKFDSAFADFAPSETNLKDLYVADPACRFYGWTVGEVLTEAEKVLGGYGSYTPDEMNGCVTLINENFKDLGDNGFLSLTPP